MRALLGGRHEIAPLALAVLFACGGGAEGEGGGGGGGSGQGADGGAMGGGDAAPEEESEPAVCRPTCSTPQDCATDDSPQLEAKNYDCESGQCRWKGCLSDDDCLNDYVCRSYDGRLPFCVAPCSGEGVCGAGHPDPILDSDNYECVEGGCRHLGCHTGECVERHDAQWTCTEEIYGFPNCLKSCSTPADCAPDFDWADVVACQDGYCVMTCDDDSCGEEAVCR